MMRARPHSSSRRFPIPLFWPIAALAGIALGLLLLEITASGQSRLAPSSATGAGGPPTAPARPATDEYYGTKVADPYRYFENLKAPEVQAWFKAENDYTRATLGRIPGRSELLARIKALDEAAPARVFDVRQLPGNRYFYQKRLASEDVGKLYLRDGLTGQERLLVDPGKLPAPRGSHNTISYYTPSFDGAYLVYGASGGGSEDAIIHIVETTTGRESSETIDRGWFASPSWLPDGRSFFHNRMQKVEPGMPPAERELKSRVYLHVLGTDPEKDRAIFGLNASPRVKIGPADIPIVATFPGSPYAFGLVLHGVQREISLYVTPLDSVAESDIPWRPVCDVEDDVTDFAPQGDTIYLLSHKDAPRFKVIRTSLAHPDVVHAGLVEPASEAVIQGLAAAQDALYVQLLDGGIGRIVRVPFTGANAGKPEKVALPFEGAASFAAFDPRLPGILLELTSWTKAPRVYSYNAESGQIADTNLQPLGRFDNPQDVESEEVKARSYDGTMVPLSIVHQKGLKLDGSHPALLRGYGAYGITEDPFFDPKLLAWVERGGVYAVAHVRGGGEYGEEWHLAGKMLTKHNTWRDFIACGQYLVDHGYTAPARLAGQGGSAGGITIGRAITERPDLFRAAIDNVGMSDAVRVELSPNGPPNIPEFGSVKTADGFKGLYEMSAYHHVKDGVAYPAVMLTTGINDPRVSPWEPGKLAARLQAATSSGKPILLRVDYEAGHGIGSTKTQHQEEIADEWAFLLWQFGVPEFQPASASR